MIEPKGKSKTIKLPANDSFGDFSSPVRLAFYPKTAKDAVMLNLSNNEINSLSRTPSSMSESSPLGNQKVEKISNFSMMVSALSWLVLSDSRSENIKDFFNRLETISVFGLTLMMTEGNKFDRFSYSPSLELLVLVITDMKIAKRIVQPFPKIKQVFEGYWYSENILSEQVGCLSFVVSSARLKIQFVESRPNYARDILSVRIEEILQTFPTVGDIFINEINGNLSSLVINLAPLNPKKTPLGNAGFLVKYDLANLEGTTFNYVKMPLCIDPLEVDIRLLTRSVILEQPNESGKQLKCRYVEQNMFPSNFLLSCFQIN